MWGFCDTKQYSPLNYTPFILYIYIKNTNTRKKPTLYYFSVNITFKLKRDHMYIKSMEANECHQVENSNGNLV